MKDNKIIQLDKEISNKIAAGEVVERPLAVIKELVENAIDAGSTKITVEIKDAGKTLMRVTDNGSGIHPDDIELAFERHSTSKIRTINDIYHISSLGFRGEALASIASVSNMEVVSKFHSEASGKRLVLSGGKIKENISVGSPDGTTMMVKDLFFNTPARLKFLKSNLAEQNAINDIMTKLALSHPEVAFKYVVNGEKIFITPGNNKLIDVILNIYPRNISKHLIPVEFEENGITLKGYCSTIELTRGNRQYQVAFVNNRYVKSKVVEDAISAVYRTLIPHNRYPIAFLNIEIDPSLIDINIHPAKTEIRFHQEGVIKDLIYKALRFEINKFDLVPEKPLNSKPIENREVLRSYAEVNQTKQSDLLREKPKSLVKETSIVKENHEKQAGKLELNNPSKKPLVNRTSFVKPEKNHREETKILLENFKQVKQIKEEILEEAKSSLAKPLVREEKVIKDVYVPAKSLLEKPSSTIYDDLIFIGQVFNTYLIYQKFDEMYLIDQHAAHEKILYEKFMEDYRNKQLMSQMILEPIVVNLNKMTVDQVIGHEKLIAKLGFQVEAFGDDSIVVREIPLGFHITQAKEMITHLVEQLDFSLPEERIELALDAIAQRSCKAAIKANDSLMGVEVKSLVDQLKTLNDPYTCPHGRPIIIKISKQEIEKKFNRT